MRSRIAALFLLGTTLMVLAGCHTVKGLGKDIRSGGGKIEDAAEFVKDKVD
ncbi:MAG: entericidin A/B family lipoprotein [bacterium]|nr:entericidin A/B family lipoprotein [bacterium]